jgi:general secretion pathway protein E/type IV pilus assembly protein PilB
LIKTHFGVGGETVTAMVQERASESVELLQDTELDESEVAKMAQEASVVRLVNEILVEAANERASDIHVEPEERGLRIRYRIDGILQTQTLPPEISRFQAAIISRIKIMARLNIAEKRLPQDGRIKMRVNNREIDVRVSIIPMLHGEGIVLRLLDKTRMVFNLANVGMLEDTYKTFAQLIDRPHGIVLVTGPTGSGKTTTLYSALNEIKNERIKIITVEDPVEYHNEGLSQIQVHTKIGLTFAAGLRSILRHDPDVILIGEIRDMETAESAIQASLTGHLVFSTLHTNDAPSAFTRLIDMGIEPFLVGSTVEGVLAQRLVRTICSECKVEWEMPAQDVPADFPKNGDQVRLWKGAGCRACRQTGFRGRTGIYELMVTGDTIREMCVQRDSAVTIRNQAIKEGMITLRQDGWRKVLNGTTTIDEVARVTAGDVIA